MEETKRTEETIESINQNLINIASMLNGVFMAVLNEEQRRIYIKKGVESGWIDDSSNDIVPH